MSKTKSFTRLTAAQKRVAIAKLKKSLKNDMGQLKDYFDLGEVFFNISGRFKFAVKLIDRLNKNINKL